MKITIAQTKPKGTHMPKKRYAVAIKQSLSHNDNEIFLQLALERLDLLLTRAVFYFRQKHANNGNTTHWQVISEEEINKILGDKIAAQKETTTSYIQEIEAINEKISTQEKNYSEYLTSSREKNQLIPICFLQKTFNLSLSEIDILIICLAPMIDWRYARIYAYLQDSLTKTSTSSLTLIWQILAPTLHQHLKIKENLTSNSALSTWQLIQNSLGKSINLSELDEQPIKLALDIGYFLLDAKVSIDEALVLHGVESSFNTLIISDALRKRLIEISTYLRQTIKNDSCLFYFYGIDQGNLKDISAAFFETLTLTSYFLDIKVLLQYLAIYGIEATCDFITSLMRQVLLKSGVMIIYNVDMLCIEETNILWLSRHLLNRAATVFRFITFIGNDVQKFKEFFANQNNGGFQLHIFHQAIPDYELSCQLWSRALNDRGICLLAEEIQALASTLHFSASQISTIVDTATRESLGNPNNITQDLLFRYSKEQNQGKLASLASLRQSKQSFQDLVLPKETITQLEEICYFKKHHHKIYRQWNFATKMNTRQGIAALFHGHSGTGKSMAANIIANELNLDLYRIDLAMIVSKYIGETEKNLSQIFDTAKALDVVLFFDEADSLFSKRTQINSSHDRYANIETGYLLQRLEEYSGVAILATNLLKNIDEAFLRRFHFIVEFPLPDVTQRKDLWQKAFPKEVNLSSGINIDFLAEKLKITGSNISNIALHAAFIAAHLDEPISMAAILQAAKYEYHKLGKLFVESDFKSY